MTHSRSHGKAVTEQRLEPMPAKLQASSVTVELPFFSCCRRGGKVHFGPCWWQRGDSPSECWEIAGHVSHLQLVPGHNILGKFRSGSGPASGCVQISYPDAPPFQLQP